MNDLNFKLAIKCEGLLLCFNYDKYVTQLSDVIHVPIVPCGM